MDDRKIVPGQPKASVEKADHSPTIAEGARLMRAFLQIPDPAGRQSVIEMAERLARQN